MRRGCGCNERFGAMCGSAILLACAWATPQLCANTIPTSSLTWNFDETGNLPAPIDSSTAGNNYNGISKGNVAGGAASLQGTAYSGFTSTGSYVTYDFGSGKNVWKSSSFTVSTLVQNPNIASGSVALIARGANGTSGGGGSGSDVPWEIYIDGNTSQLVLVAQNWNAARSVYTSSALTFSPNQWYQVALSCSFSYDSATKLYHELFNVYVTPAGATAVVNVLTADYATPAGLSNGTQIVVGGGERGYYAEAKAGSFGGAMDDVNVWLGTALTADQLSQTLTSVPEPASMGVLAVGCLAMMGLGRKRS